MELRFLLCFLIGFGIAIGDKHFKVLFLVLIINGLPLVFAMQLDKVKATDYD